MRRRRSILGPIVLITVGVLFALDYIGNRWDFSQTWPVILVVIGIVKLFERMVWDDPAYYGNGPQPWGPPWTHQAPPAPNSGAYPGTVPPPPGTAQAAPPPPPQPAGTPDYPTYPSYPSSTELGNKPGDGHAS